MGCETSSPGGWWRGGSGRPSQDSTIQRPHEGAPSWVDCSAAGTSEHKQHHSMQPSSECLQLQNGLFPTLELNFVFSFFFFCRTSDVRTHVSYWIRGLFLQHKNACTIPDLQTYKRWHISLFLFLRFLSSSLVKCWLPVDRDVLQVGDPGEVK